MNYTWSESEVDCPKKEGERVTGTLTVHQNIDDVTVVDDESTTFTGKVGGELYEVSGKISTSYGYDKIMLFYDVTTPTFASGYFIAMAVPDIPRCTYGGPIILSKIDGPAQLIDFDKDGVADSMDKFPNNPSEWMDTDRDGLGNNSDIDDDNDGMPDSWEEQYGLNPLANNANVDTDSDGFTNKEEYDEGTNPVDPKSFPVKAMPWIPLLLGD